MTGMDAEHVLQGVVAQLMAAGRGKPLHVVPFSVEAVANAFVMLGLVPEQRVEEMLSKRRTAMEGGFSIGVLTGEVSVRPGDCSSVMASQRSCLWTPSRSFG